MARPASTFRAHKRNQTRGAGAGTIGGVRTPTNRFKIKKTHVRKTTHKRRRG